MAFNENASDLFRLAETAAPKEDRVMPPYRSYGASYGTLSLEEAIAKMKARRRDPGQFIPGGLDDPSVEKEAQEEVRATSDMAKTGNAEAYTPEPSRKARRTKTSAAGKDADLPEIRRLIEDIHTRVMSEHNAREEKPDEDALSEFKGCRHKVTFLTNGLSFTVRCLNMVKDDDSHCLVLAFPEDGESFFEPQPQSELEIRYDGKSVGGKLFYFGMCFVVRQLGLRFLGFLFDEKREDKEER